MTKMILLRRRPLAGGGGMRLKTVFLVVTGLALSAPAAAQLSPGYSGHSGVRSLGSSDTFYAIRQLGHCLAGQKTAQARALVAAEPGSDAEEQASRALIGRETSCLRYANRLLFTRDMLRGSVAEALYRREVSSPPAAVEAPAPIDISLEGLDERQRQALLPRLLLADFASCFAAVKPDLAHRLITTTRLGTSEEEAQVAEMAPQFATCLPAGGRFQIYSETVRLALAEALYRRARSAVASAQARAD